MTKADIVSAICRETGYNRTAVARTIDALFENITKAMSNGEDVKFSGFGTFVVKKRAARTGRNPHTNEPVPIPARTVPGFEAGKDLKKAVTK